MKTRPVMRAKVDQTGMGEKVVEDLILEHGDRVQGVLLTGPARVSLALALARAFEAGLIRIPSNRPDIRADLRAIKRKGSAEAGTLRIVNEGEVHADWFWALALLWDALDGQFQLIAYLSVPKVRFGDNGGPPLDDFQRRTSQTEAYHRNQMRGRGFGHGAY